MQNATTPNTQSAPGLLHDTLRQIQRDLTALRALTQAVHEEITATRAIIAKRRLTRAPAVVEPLDRVLADMQTRLDAFWENFHQPIQQHRLMNIYSRRLAPSGHPTPELIARLPNAHSFVGATGGLMLIPRTAWDDSYPDERAQWLGATPKKLARERDENIKQMHTVYSQARLAPSDLTEDAPSVTSPLEGT